MGSQARVEIPKLLVTRQAVSTRSRSDKSHRDGILRRRSMSEEYIVAPQAKRPMPDPENMNAEATGPGNTNDTRLAVALRQQIPNQESMAPWMASMTSDIDDDALQLEGAARELLMAAYANAGFQATLEKGLLGAETRIDSVFTKVDTICGELRAADAALGQNPRHAARP